MSFYPRSGSETIHNNAVALCPIPSLVDAAKLVDPSFLGGFSIQPDVDWSNVQESDFDWIGDSAGGTTDGYVCPAKADIIAKYAEVYAAWEAKAYQRHREIEYPSLDQQLDMQYWDAINGTTNWADAINAVKTAYPKPN